MLILKQTGLALFLAFLNILIIHTVKNKFPRHYFSLGQIVINENEDITILGILTKFFPPLLISFFIGFFSNKDSYELSVLFSFFASFLVIWPVILSKDEILSWEARKKINILYVIYILYISQYMLLGLFGNFLGTSVKNGVSNFSFLSYIQKYDQLSSFGQNIVGGLIASAMFSLFLFVINRIYKYTFSRLKIAMDNDQRRRMEEFSDYK